MTSRRELRRRAREMELGLKTAHDKLEDLGYEALRFSDGEIYGWTLSDEAVEAEKEREEKHAASLEKRLTRVREDAELSARRLAVAKIVEALEITGYGRFGPGQGIKVDKFWDDIETALAVRAEKKAADERAETEARVSGLASKPKYAAGGLIESELNSQISAVSSKPATIELSPEDRALLASLADVNKRESSGWDFDSAGEREPIAEADDLERHMEKQGVSWDDAWNYFRDNGYAVDHLPYTREEGKAAA